MALQFGPMLLLGMHAGALAERRPKRSILLTTQSLNAAATLARAVVTIAGRCAQSMCKVRAAERRDLRVRRVGQAVVVNQVVPEEQLRAAIALNAAASRRSG